MQKIELTPALIRLNEQANKIYDFDKITSYIADLNKNGWTQVGYLSSCGTTHPTLKIFRLWVKAVKLIEKQGITLTKEDIKQKNAYATTNGGFRTETKYSIAK